MKRIILALFLLVSPMIAQRPALIPPVVRFADSNGKPLALGTLTSYSAGTTTPLATFVDSTTGALNPNPTPLDATGSASIFLGPNVYKFVLKNSAGVVQWTADNIAEGSFQTSNVLSFTGHQGTTRTGAVVAIAGDYTCAMVTGCSTVPTIYYQTIQDGGSSLPQEPIQNFISGVSGGINTFIITAGGTGYTGAPTVTFTGGSCASAPTGSTVVTGGAVTSGVIVSPGSGCTSAPTPNFSGGGGTGATGATTLFTNGVVCVDNPTNHSTDCTFTGGGGGSGGTSTVTDETFARAYGTIYTNSLTVPLLVTVSGAKASTGCTETPMIGASTPTISYGQQSATPLTSAPASGATTFLVPASYVYEVVTDSCTLDSWVEATLPGGGSGGGGTGIPTTPTNALVKINGTNGAASSVVDNGTTVSTTEPVTAPSFNGVALSTAGPNTLYLDKTGAYSTPPGGVTLAGAVTGPSGSNIIAGLGSTAGYIPQTDGAGKLLASIANFDTNGFLNIAGPGVNMIGSFPPTGGSVGYYISNTYCGNIYPYYGVDTGDSENGVYLGHTSPCNATGQLSPADTSFVVTTGSAHAQVGGTTATITNVSLTSNVVTITASNSFTTSNAAALNGMTVASFLNGGIYPVLSASSTQFTIAFTHANVSSASETGTAAPFVDNVLYVGHEGTGQLNLGPTGSPLISLRSGLSPNGVFFPTLTSIPCLGTDSNGKLGSGTCSGGTTTVIQVNGTPTSTATPVNLQTSTVNSVGLTITPSNPSAGNVKMEITGASPTFGTSVSAPLFNAATGALSIGTVANQPVHLFVNSNATDSITLNATGTVTFPSLGTGLIKTTSGLFGNATAGSDYAIGINPTGGQNNYAPIASPTFTGTVTGPTIVASTTFNSPSYVTPASGTATSGANFGSGCYGANGSYWTGSVSNTDSWTWCNVLGTGANPTTTLTATHSAGSSGAAKVSVPNLIVAGQTGSQQSAEFDTNGNLVGVAKKPRSIAFQYGTPGGAALSTGVMGYITVPFACTIGGWSIQADAGTATIKWLKVAAGTAIPTLGSNSINTSGVSLSTGTVIQSTTLTDFTTTTVTANDILAADLITVATAGYIAGQLTCQ